jgi:hypothetical protein
MGCGVNTGLIAPLSSGEGLIYELKLKGKPAYRISVFVTTCTGKSTAVLCQIVPHEKLNTTGNVDRFVGRAENMRADWLKRNCPDAKPKGEVAP